jgi:hypothetical protein
MTGVRPPLAFMDRCIDARVGATIWLAEEFLLPEFYACCGVVCRVKSYLG